MVTPRPSVNAGRNVFTYSGELTGIPMGDAPQLLGTSYTITAEVEIPEARPLGLGVPQAGDGMIATQGGRFGGWGLYVLKGKPIYVWNLLDLKRVRWEGAKALSPGKHTLEFDFKYDGLGFATLVFNNTSGIGRGATGVLKVDGRVVATQTMERAIPVILQWDENFDIGADTGTPVDAGTIRSRSVSAARMTSGASPANSAACLRSSSELNEPHRLTICRLRPSVQPNSRSPCRNAAKRAFVSSSSGVVVMSTPIRRTRSATSSCPGGMIMTGYELVSQARERCPSLKALLTSGYDPEIASSQDGTASELRVLRKPYKQAELARALAE
jgi:hypothetical protein